MTETDIKQALDNHKQWLRDKSVGERADLRGADLRYADLRYAELRYAELRGAELRGADLRNAELRYAELRGADLRNANLRGAELRGANLRYAELRGANLRYAELRYADLSQSQGLPSATKWMETHLTKASDGYIAYKSFGLHRNPPEAWTIESGEVISETVSPVRTIDCACGVNVGTKEWVEENANGEIWKVLLRWEWLPDVVVPYNTDGKFRTGKVELLETIGD